MYWLCYRLYDDISAINTGLRFVIIDNVSLWKYKMLTFLTDILFDSDVIWLI